MARTEYVLIERPEYHPTAVRRDVLSQMIADGDMILTQRPITKAEIKREKVHVLDYATYQRLREFDLFRKKFTGLVFKARVLWFNTMSGAGFVEGLNGEGRWPLWACNIPGKKTWYPETACVFHDAGDVIDAEIMVSYGGNILVSHTPGTVDQEKWDKLDQRQLAFRCDENGQAINGLFSEGASL